MKQSTKKRPRDPNQLAAYVVADAVGDAPATDEPANTKNPAAVELGRLGGLKGGKARAEQLSPARRKEIASKAAKARWDKYHELLVTVAGKKGARRVTIEVLQGIQAQLIDEKVKAEEITAKAREDQARITTNLASIEVTLQLYIGQAVSQSMLARFWELGRILSSRPV